VLLFLNFLSHLNSIEFQHSNKLHLILLIQKITTKNSFTPLLSFFSHTNNKKHEKRFVGIFSRNFKIAKLASNNYTFDFRSFPKIDRAVNMGIHSKPNKHSLSLVPRITITYLASMNNLRKENANSQCFPVFLAPKTLTVFFLGTRGPAIINSFGILFADFGCVKTVCSVWICKNW
jgi:hypothetical protein